MNFRPIFHCLLVLAAVIFTGVAHAQSVKNNFSVEPGTIDPNRPGYELILEARLDDDGKTIERGMIWRVFREQEDASGQLPLVATGKGGTASFTLNAGVYLVHASLGRAGTSKRVTLAAGGKTESFTLNAGGLQLNATSEDQPINPKYLRFSIYELEQNEEGDRKLIALNAGANKVIPLNAGTYHVLSRFGTINATVRADLEVKAGKVTKAILQHRGAEVGLRLVSQSGGDPIANTAWSVFTQDGEKVFSSRSVSPSLVLAEGTYEATVRNGDSTLRQTFDVRPGGKMLVEVLLK